MILDYQKQQFIQKLSLNCSLFKAIKQNKPYFMYEYQNMNMSDQYHFKVLKKLTISTNVLHVLDKFQNNGASYFITNYVESNLLKEQFNQQHKLFKLDKALAIFAYLTQIIEELHQNNIIYRNLRLQTVKYQKDELFLADFTYSQIVKRRERYFEIVGVPNYLAPEFFTQDGYGYEVDVWAMGVCLYFMVTDSFPFNMEGKSEQEMLKQIQSKCKKGFRFVDNARESKKAKYIQSSKNLEDLFQKLFELDYNKRITIKQLKVHPAIKEYFDSNEGPLFDLGSDMMSVIPEQDHNYQNGSIFMSMLSNFKCHLEFHKEQIVLDFMEHSSQILSLNLPETIDPELKALVNFSILKVAAFKVQHLMGVLEGAKKPDFEIDRQEWEDMKKTAGFKKIKQKLEKKKKIILTMFKAAYMGLPEKMHEIQEKKKEFYSDQIAEDFAAIKRYFILEIFSEYRLNLSKIFEVEIQIMKKQTKQKARKTCENLARLAILCMVNRVFQEQNRKEAFKWYYQWYKKESLQNLQEWIENQKLSNLKPFIKHLTTTKYVD